MRKLSEKRKSQLLRHAKREHDRRKKERRKRYWRRVAKLGRPARQRIKEQVTLKLPAILSFDSAYRQTVDFLDKLHFFSDHQETSLYLDFTTLQHIGPAASLALVAELDRWRTIGKFRPRVMEVDQWDKEILALLSQMGLFQLLEVVNPPKMPEPGSLRFIKFRSHQAYSVVDGALAEKLRNDLNEISGLDQSVSDKDNLYRGLTEAMLNVRNHAYRKESGKRLDIETRMRKGWMFGAYDQRSQRLTCAFYDMGVGIPVRMREMYSPGNLTILLTDLGFKNDGPGLIRAAMRTGGTRTGKSHRGRGLKGIKRFAEEASDGQLRILSDTGQYLYINDRDASKPLSPPLRGTLIQWEITLPQNQKGQCDGI